jgi:hypothetical protein
LQARDVHQFREWVGILSENTPQSMNEFGRRVRRFSIGGVPAQNVAEIIICGFMVACIIPRVVFQTRFSVVYLTSLLALILQTVRLLSLHKPWKRTSSATLDHKLLEGTQLRSLDSTEDTYLSTSSVPSWPCRSRGLKIVDCSGNIQCASGPSERLSVILG